MSSTDDAPAFLLGGNGAVLARGVPHSDEVRAAALAALLAGESVTDVSKRFRLNHATVISWRDSAGLGSTQVQPKKRAEIGDRVIELLGEILTTLRTQSVAFRDTEWLKKYSPAEAATNFGILADKAIYLAASLEQPDNGEGQETE